MIIGSQGGSYHDWYDSDGPYYDCDWYSQGIRCSAYGHGYENDGFTANQACCACGGGRDEDSYRFGSCTKDDFTESNGYGKQLLDTLQSAFDGAVDAWKEVMCALETVNQQTCNVVQRKICPFDLVCDIVSEHICTWTVVGYNWNCGNAINEFSNIEDEFKEMVVTSYNSAASHCGGPQIDRRRLLHKASEKRRKLTRECSYPDGMSSESCPNSDHAGVGFEVGISGVVFMFEVNVAFGYAWTMNGWEFGYGMISLGGSTEVLSPQAMIGLHFFILDESFLGEGVEFAAGVTTPVAEFGISVSYAFSLPSWTYNAVSMHIHIGAGFSPFDLGGSKAQVDCLSPELICYTD